MAGVAAEVVEARRKDGVLTVLTKRLELVPRPGSIIAKSTAHRPETRRNRAHFAEEGWNRGRYGVYHDLESWRRYLSAAGFVELTHYYRPTGLPRAQQPWLVSVWRKPS